VRRFGESSSKRRNEPIWYRFRWIGLGLLLFVVIGVLWLAMSGGLPASNLLLTITKPVGGTVLAPGITCGTRGSDCSVSRPKGDPIELTPQADAGFTFVGYTGDCAPSGRTIMNAARTCGATFVKSDDAPDTTKGATQVMTIAPVPTHGTLEGVDIICGSKGSVCSANYPEGVPVEFHPTPDEGYTFMGFVGDCVPLGHTQMNAPRTCSATFSLTSEVSNAQPPKIPTGGRRASGAPSPAPAVAPPTEHGPDATPPTGTRPETSGKQGSPAVPAPATGPVAPPKTDEEFAKDRIQETLKALCDAEEALDPERVRQVFPKAPMDAYRAQLNPSKYRSVQCKFGDVVYVSLDAPGGKATVQAPKKVVYQFTILTEKPKTDELNATIWLVRLGTRTQWVIEKATYKQK
jgi:hypothetical protein